MRLVQKEPGFADASNRFNSEAKTACGNGAVLKHFMYEARHIVVEFVADGQGGVAHLFERDCSAQRRRNRCSIKRALSQ